MKSLNRLFLDSSGLTVTGSITPLVMIAVKSDFSRSNPLRARDRQ
jgi:hypothetical protein